MHKNEYVLVTGGTGLLGKGLEKTAPKGLKVISAHLRDYEVKGPKNAEHIVADVLDKSRIDALFEKYKFSAVIHGAGIANVDYVESHYDESYISNINGTKNIAEACKRHGSYLIYISTNAVFDGKNAPYSEADLINPINSYGKIKAECEKLVFKILPDSAVARPILMYGWNHPQTRQNPVTWIISKLAKGEPLKLVNDVFENPLYNIQCAKTLWAIEQKRLRGITHIAGGEIINRYDFGLKTAKVFGLDKSLISAVDSSFFPAIAPRPKNTSFNISKMFRESGIKPLSVIEGLMLMKQEVQE